MATKSEASLDAKGSTKPTTLSLSSSASSSRPSARHRAAAVIRVESLWKRRLQWTIRTAISGVIASLLAVHPSVRPIFAVPYMVPVIAVWGSLRNFGGTAQYCFQMVVGSWWGAVASWITFMIFRDSDVGRCVFWWVATFLGAFLHIQTKCPPTQTKLFVGINATAMAKFIRVPDATPPSYAFHLLLDIVVGIACSLLPMMLPTPRSTVRLATDRLAYAARLNTLAFESLVDGFLCRDASRSQIYHVRSMKTIKTAEENMESVRSLLREVVWMPRRRGILDQLTQRLKILEWQKSSLSSLCNALQVTGPSPMTFSAPHIIACDYLRAPLLHLRDTSAVFMKRYFNLHRDDASAPNREPVIAALRDVHQKWLLARIRIFYPPPSFTSISWTTGDSLCHNVYMFNVDNYAQPLCFPDAPNSTFDLAVHHTPSIHDFKPDSVIFPHTALVVKPYDIGYRPVAEIASFLTAAPEFRSLVGEDVAMAFETISRDAHHSQALEKDAIRAIFSRLMTCSAVDLKYHLDKLIQRLNAIVATDQESKEQLTTSSSSSTAATAPVLALPPMPAPLATLPPPLPSILSSELILTHNPGDTLPAAHVLRTNATTAPVRISPLIPPSVNYKLAVDEHVPPLPLPASSSSHEVAILLPSSAIPSDGDSKPSSSTCGCDSPMWRSIWTEINRWFVATFTPLLSTKPSDYRKAGMDAFRIATAIILSGLLVIVPHYRTLVESGSFAPNTVSYLYSGNFGGSFQTALQRLWGTVAGCIWGYITLLLTHSEPYAMVALATVFVLISSYVRSNKAWSYSGLVASFVQMSVMFGYDPKGTTGVADFALNRIAQTMFGIIVYLLLEFSLFPHRASELARQQLVRVLVLNKDFCVRRWVLKENELRQDLPHSEQIAPPPAVPAQWCASYGMEMGGSRALLKAAIATHELLLTQASAEPELWHPVFPLPLYQRIILCERNMMRCFVDADRAFTRMSMLNGNSLPHREALREPFRHFYVCAVRAITAYITALQTPHIARTKSGTPSSSANDGHTKNKTKTDNDNDHHPDQHMTSVVNNTNNNDDSKRMHAPVNNDDLEHTHEEYDENDNLHNASDTATGNGGTGVRQRTRTFDSDIGLGQIKAANRLVEQDEAVARLAPGTLLYSINDSLKQFDAIFTRWFEDHLVETYRRHRIHHIIRSTSRDRLAKPLSSPSSIGAPNPMGATTTATAAAGSSLIDDLPNVCDSIDHSTPSAAVPSAASAPSSPSSQSSSSSTNSMPASPLDPNREWNVVLPTMTNIDAMTLFAICASIRALTEQLIIMGHLVREVLHNEHIASDVDSALEFT